MYWTLELASKLEDAPWPATKDELIDYATRSGAPLEVIENLNDLEDDGEVKLYYGASDTYECMATANVNDLIDYCKNNNWLDEQVINRS